MKTIPIKEFYIIDYGDGTFYKESFLTHCESRISRFADSTQIIQDATQFETFGEADAALQNNLTSVLQFKSSIKKVSVVYQVSN